MELLLASGGVQKLVVSELPYLLMVREDLVFVFVMIQEKVTPADLVVHL